MIRSMTGFGRGAATAGGASVTVEVRSVNNRNLRTTFRLPERLQGLEQELEIALRRSVTRGSLTVGVTLEEPSGDPGYVLDASAMRYYREAFESAGSADVPLAVLVTLPGVVRRKMQEELPDELRKATMQALDAALSALRESREREGAFLWEDIAARARAIAEFQSRVEARIPAMVDEYRRRLHERLGKLLQGAPGPALTPEDLHREVALYADRSDISEECARLKSHLSLLNEGPAAEEPYGRKLEFITQEMFREANTMASKSNDAAMVHDVLDIKAEIEKLREQALNVE